MKIGKMFKRLKRLFTRRRRQPTQAVSSPTLQPTTQSRQSNIQPQQPAAQMGLPLYMLLPILGIRQQEEAFIRDIENQARMGGMALGLRGLGTSSVAAAMASDIAERRARGLADIRRQGLMQAIELRRQLMQEFGTILRDAIAQVSAQAAQAGQIGQSLLGAAGATYGALGSQLQQAITGLGMVAGYQSFPSLPSTPAATPPPSASSLSIPGEFGTPISSPLPSPTLPTTVPTEQPIPILSLTPPTPTPNLVTGWLPTPEDWESYFPAMPPQPLNTPMAVPITGSYR